MKKENSPNGSIKEDNWRGFSMIFNVLLPMAGLALIWGQRGLFAKFLTQLDRNCISVYCPSLSKREQLLKWASGRLPSTWSSQAATLSNGISELWKDGSLLCTLINSVIPGACPNPHRHWRKPPLHAQALAYKYFGLTPVFSDADFSSEMSLNQERSFIAYLEQLQNVIGNWPEEDLNVNISSQYVVRGMGLYNGEQNQKTIFYLYTTVAKHTKSDVLIYIRGPYGVEGKTTISPMAKGLMETKNSSNLFAFTSILTKKTVSPIIPIQAQVEKDRWKIVWTPFHSGVYEINLISNGEILKGSPFNVQVEKEIVNSKKKLRENNIKDTKPSTRCKNITNIIEMSHNLETIQISNDTEIQKRQIPEKIVNLSRKEDNGTSTKKSSFVNDKTEGLKVAQTLEANDASYKTDIEKTQLGKEIVTLVENPNKNKLKNTKGNTERLKAGHKTKKTVLSSERETEKTQVEKGEKQNKNDLKITELTSPGKNNSTELQAVYRFKDTNTGYEMAQTISRIDKEAEASENNFDETDYLKSSLIPETIKSLKEIANRTKLKAKEEKTVIEKDENDNCLEVLNSNETSPICTNHIDLEVERNQYQKLPFSEKRRIFSKSNIFTNDSVFSTENNGLSNDKKEESEVDDVKSVEHSRSSTPSDTYSSYSTFSLPNMGFPVTDSMFQKRKNYWESLVSVKSSSVSLSNSGNEEKFRARCALKTQRQDMTQSCVDLSTLNKRQLSTQRDIDSSLEDCTIVPLEERKKQLLKNMYEEEKMNIVKNRKKTVHLPKEKIEVKASTDDTDCQKPPSTFFYPISERVKKFEAISNDSLNAEEDPDTSEKINKLQFNRALIFFKALETKAPQLKRSRSFEFEIKKPFLNKRGSLNLGNISDRFDVKNLYNDVFGGRRGSFKGTPNNSEMATALASFQSLSNAANSGSDEICYKLFANITKPKKRKSIKPLFNVNY